MKRRFYYLSIIFFIIQIGIFIFISGCEKDENPAIPVLTTSAVKDLTDTTATCGGNISSDGGATVTARGVCWTINQTPTTDDNKTDNGKGTGSFTSHITGLTPDTIYCFRAYATNSAGTGYGNIVAITTPSSHTVPVVITSPADIVTESSASCSGEITSDGGEDIITSGICWSTGATPTIDDDKTTDGANTGSFTSLITGLTPDTKYYFRAYATNSIGTGYGNILSFNTSDLLTDIDGNTYHSVLLGTQVWMVENLNVTHYRNGDKIPNITNSEEWRAWDMSTGAYCNYKNNSSYAKTYGRLYNHYAVIDSRKIAPEGWHVATDKEWERLEQVLCCLYEGGKLKEAGTSHWKSPNEGATNESGFTALPGGYRVGYDDDFYGLGTTAFFWTSDGDSFHGYYRRLSYFDAYIDNGLTVKEYGCSVRCVRD
jgi:uncharacterized protein (TIGR02145 family)